MTRMKSAFEKAMERAESMGEPTPEERLQIKFLPQGERLAVEYLKGEGDLKSTVEECNPEARPYLVKGACEVLTHNLRLPRTEEEQSHNERILQGLRLLKSDKTSVNEIASRVENISSTFHLYHQQGLEQAYQETKQRFLQTMQEALQKHTGGVPTNRNVNVEAMPEFQQEWARVATQFTSQYQGPFEEQKDQLRAIP